MRIAFHGAAQTVTGSKHLVKLSDGKNVLLDCGMFQGMGKETNNLNRHFGFNPVEVDALLLSHAHIDHSGLIPRLVREGFQGTIYCTPATMELTGLLLADSAEIQSEDIRYVNKRRSAEGLPYLSPLYEMKDVQNSMQLFKTVEYDTWFEVTDRMQCMFGDAGHIIGSAFINLRVNEDGRDTSITYSGDIGRYRDVILRSPEQFPQADYILLESTYGNRLHEPFAITPDFLLDWITKTCVEKKGKLIMPAFSLGRTQELLYHLNQLELENRLPRLDYFIDSPLSVEISEVVKKYSHLFNRRIKKQMEKDDDPFLFKNMKYIKTVEQSKSLNYRNDPCVIISASGMAEAGRVKHHISNNIENSRNAILMTGYCEPNSLGGRLMNGEKEVRIFGTLHQVHAEIGSIQSMSAHGDYEDLSQWLSCQNPDAVKKIFLVHGDPEVQLQFKNRLIKKFADIEIPERHSEYSLK